MTSPVANNTNTNNSNNMNMHDDTQPGSTTTTTILQQQQQQQQQQQPRHVLQSQIPSIWSKITAQLNRLEDLEKRLNSHTSRSRRRIQNILDQIPSYRKSHLRLFITHTYDRRTGIWTLCIEGKLLVGNKDHANATLVDVDGVLSVREQSTSKTGPEKDDVDTQEEADEEEDGGKNNNNNNNNNNGDPSKKVSQTDTSNNPLPDRTLDRSQYKMGEKEEDPVEPLIFTHFFDTLEVTFRTIYQPKVVPTEPPSSLSSTNLPIKKSRSTKRKAVPKSDVSIDVDPKDLRASAPTEFRWTKDSGKTEDSYGFWIKYNNHFSERPPPHNMKFHSVAANIRLYPSRPTTSSFSSSSMSMGDDDDEQQQHRNRELDNNSESIYRVSTSMARHFFATRHSSNDNNIIGGTVKHSSSSPRSSPAPKRKKLNQDSSNDDDDDDDDEDDASSSSSSSSPSSSSGERQQQQGGDDDDDDNNISNSKKKKVVVPDDTIPVDNYIDVPALLSYNEIVMTIFQYVQDNQLYDPTDRSLIVCDEKLTSVFKTESFNFSQLHQILIGKKLITKVDVDEEPVVATYVMTEKTTSPQIPNGYQEVDDPVGSTAAAATTTTTNRKSMTAIHSLPQVQDPDHHPTVLSFDIDVAFPSLFNYRSRELLRRVKRREFDYTSSRTKARYLLVASKGSEDIVKTKIEQCISGQGYTEENTPIFLALAKAASDNSEARIAAQLDARTCDLIGRIDESSRQATTAWEAVRCLQRVMGITTKTSTGDNPERS